MTVMNLDQLDVWVKARDFSIAIYREVIPKIAPTERYTLVDQIKRAAVSIPANIAEGHGRFHFLDNVRFCYNARGSLTEVQSHLSLAKELGFLPDDVYKRMTIQAESLVKQLNNYIAYLKRSKQSENEKGSRYEIREEFESYHPDLANDSPIE